MDLLVNKKIADTVESQNWEWGARILNLLVNKKNSRENRESELGMESQKFEPFS